jgi:hypothetical protein
VYNNFTCDCGHNQEAHGGELIICMDCYKRDLSNPDEVCIYPWHEFKPNNLKHLEQLATDKDERASL